MKRILPAFLGVCLFSTQAFAGKILLLRADAEEMKVVKDVVAQDLSAHQIKDVVVSKTTTAGEVKALITAEKPDVIALLDNKAVSLLKEVQDTAKPDEKVPDAAATMALNLKKRLPEMKNVSGIAFEVPALTIITRYRSLSGVDVKNVLAPYRASDFTDSMKEAVEQLKKEGINLIAVDVDKAGKDSAAINKFLEKTLADTYEGKKIDAILVPTDNVILNKEGFATVWLEKSKSVKVPFLCNVEKFVSKDFDFCAYAAFPDFVDLGHQYSEQLAEMLDNKTPASDLGVDYIVAAKEAIFLEKASKLGAKPTEEKLSNVKVIK